MSTFGGYKIKTPQPGTFVGYTLAGGEFAMVTYTGTVAPYFFTELFSETNTIPATLSYFSSTFNIDRGVIFTN